MHKKSMFFGMGIGILAMVAVSFVTYIVQRTAHLNENTQLMAMVEELEAATPAGSVDSYYVIDRARSIGMVFPDEIDPQIVLYFPDPIDGDEAEYVYNAGAGMESDIEPPEELDAQATPEPTSTPEPTPSPTALYNAVRMTISPGLTATQAAVYFEQMGLVDSAEEFSQFLIDNGYQTSILAGYFEVPRGSTFQEIVNIIVYGN